METLRRKIVNTFIDIIILTRLWNKSALSGYDIIAFVNKKYDVLLSSGRVYSVLYRLERKGLLRGLPDQRKRIYRLTEQGKKRVEKIQDHFGEIQNLLESIFTGG